MRTQRRDMEQRLGSEVARDGFQAVSKDKTDASEEGQVFWAGTTNGWRRERQRHGVQLKTAECGCIMGGVESDSSGRRQETAPESP